MIGNKLNRLLGFFRESQNLGLVLLALAVGLAGGAGAILFRFLIARAQDLFFNGGGRLLGVLGGYYVILLPAVGLVVVAFIVRRWAPEVRGHGVPEVQYAVRRRGGRIRARVAVVQSLASALCIGSGGSVGREGPIVQIGSSVGSSLGQFLKLREEGVKLLVAGGAAAGIGGTFNAPIAGVIFAMEVILGSFTGRSFGLVVIASVASTALVQSVLGSEPAFALPERFTLLSPAELGIYAVLGVAAGVLSITYVRTLYALERLFAEWRLNSYAKAAVGGLVVGIIGYTGMRYLGGAHLFGVGYEDVERVLALGHDGPVAAGQASVTVLVLVILILFKILATSTTLAAGGSGGVFAPSLYIGAVTGGAIGVTANQLLPTITAPAGAYALVGMGALFGGAAQAPISSIIILFEITDNYQIILPLMLSVGVSYLMSTWLSRDSIYTIKLRHLGGLSAPLASGSVLDAVLVADAMAPEMEQVRSETPVMELATRFRDRHASGLAVLDAEDVFVGLVTATDVQNALMAGDADAKTASDVMTSNPVTCRPDESLREVLQRIADQDVGQVPVVEKENPRHVVGVLRREEILWAVGEMASEHARLLARAGVDVAEGEDSAQVTVEVRPEHHELCFHRVRDVRIPGDALIAILRRGGQAIVPHGRTIIEPGDRLVVITTREKEGALLEWTERLERDRAAR